MLVTKDAGYVRVLKVQPFGVAREKMGMRVVLAKGTGFDEISAALDEAFKQKILKKLAKERAASTQEDLQGGERQEEEKPSSTEPNSDKPTLPLISASDLEPAENE